jgi:hypothetical protein
LFVTFWWIDSSDFQFEFVFILQLFEFVYILLEVGPMVSCMKVDKAPLEVDGFYYKLYENDGTHFTGS